MAFTVKEKRKRRHSVLKKFSGLERFGKALKNKKDKDEDKKKKKKKNGKPAFLLKKLNKKD